MIAGLDLAIGWHFDLAVGVPFVALFAWPVWKLVGRLLQDDPGR